MPIQKKSRIKRQKPIKFVKQRDHADCAIACLAMILNCSYEQVYNDMLNRFDKTGLKHNTSVAYLADHNINIITKEWKCYANVIKNNQRMAEPFADIHLVCVKPYADSNVHHAVVMDRNGKVYDPSDNGITKLTDYYEVVKVGGCYYD
jgi:ABC-type bacteriocin/lantibiotic exporter with double-glycine peptidase domain